MPHLKPPLYVLPFGIEVVSEYRREPYFLVRVRPHFLISGTLKNGAILVRRSRAVMTSMVGRVLLSEEHVHHENGDRSDDAPPNLRLLTSLEHNRLHKTGGRHSNETKDRIRTSLKKAYALGRHRIPTKEEGFRAAANLNPFNDAVRRGEILHPSRSCPEYQLIGAVIISFGFFNGHTIFRHIRQAHAKTICLDFAITLTVRAAGAMMHCR